MSAYPNSLADLHPAATLQQVRTSSKRQARQLGLSSVINAFWTQQDDELHRHKAPQLIHDAIAALGSRDKRGAKGRFLAAFQNFLEGDADDIVAELKVELAA
jgi:hypothetical protein